MAFGKNKKNKEKPVQNLFDSNDLLDSELIIKIIDKINEMSKYNEELKQGLANSKVTVKTKIDIIDDYETSEKKLKTELQSVVFSGPGVININNEYTNNENDEQNKEINDEKYRITVTSTCVIFFNGLYYRRLFTYDGWKGLIDYGA